MFDLPGLTQYGSNIKVYNNIIKDNNHSNFAPEGLKKFKTIINGDEKIFCGVFSMVLLKKKIGKETPKCISEGKDRYGRTLAECFVNGESLSSFLVRHGYAFAYRKYSKKFVKDEEYAKKNKIGMWVMQFEFPWDFRKNKSKKTIS